MFQCYQDFHYKVKGSEKVEKIPREALKHQALKNVNSCMKKAEVMGCLVQGWSATVNQHRQLTELSLSHFHQQTICSNFKNRAGKNITQFTGEQDIECS